jgi:hypothetical protein
VDGRGRGVSQLDQELHEGQKERVRQEKGTT